MNHAVHLETAFLQLSFSLKVEHYFELNPPDKARFDIPYTIKSHDGLDNTHLPGGQFHTNDDILIAAENNIQICFGVAVLTLWEAVNETGNFAPHILDPSRDEEQMVASLIYQIRCCFAHGTAVPKWDIRNQKYKTIYKLQNRCIDLRNLNGNDLPPIFRPRRN
jgi:hypothetical protein